MNIKLNGWKQDLPDSNDKLFSSLTPKLIKFGSSINEHILPEYTPISNQLSLNSCVANATCDALEILLGIQDPTSVIQLSRMFCYWNARMYNQETDKDEGTYIRNAFASLETLGVCPESSWEYNIKNVFAQPPIKAYKEGDDNQIKGSYRIDSYDNQRCIDIENAIRANHPVVLGIPVGQELVDYSGEDKVFSAPLQSLGSHAIIITGVRKNPGYEFLIRNSWGSGWGNKGHFWVNESYITSPYTDDLWVPTLIENII